MMIKALSLPSNTKSLLLGSLQRERYIISPMWDLIFFIGSPIIAVFFVLSLWRFLHPQTVENSVFIYMSIGHHVPTFLRAYGDPDELSANRFRLFSIPVFIVVLVCLSFSLGLQLFILTFIWDQFHFVRQHYGLMRIYDAKNKSIPKDYFNFDQWLCFSVFFAIIAHSDFYSFVYSSSFMTLGLLFPDWLGPFFRSSSLFFAIFVTLVYIANIYKKLQRGEPVSLLKLFLFISTYGVWYYSYVVFSHPFLSYPISSFFHCFQYDALAWYYNHTKAEAIGNTRNIKVFRFIHSSRNIWLYLLSIFSYGYISLLFQGAAPAFVRGLNLTTGLLHYYFDAFIWRVRKSEFRKYLK